MLCTAIGTSSNENKIEIIDEKLKNDKKQKQLHFVGSLPFANMIMNFDISESLLLNGTADASSTDDDTYVRANQEKKNLEADKIPISDRDPGNVPRNVLSAEDLVVIRSNTLLISRRKEDELRIQLAGEENMQIYPYSYCTSDSHYHPISLPLSLSLNLSLFCLCP